MPVLNKIRLPDNTLVEVNDNRIKTSSPLEAQVLSYDATNGRWINRVTVTSVNISNGGGLTISGGPITTTGTITIGHTNSVNAQTTQALYPIKIDAHGHISGYGDAITSLPASDVYEWAKQPNKPSYNFDEIPDGSTRKLGNGSFILKSKVGSTVTDIASTSANALSNSAFTLIQGSNITFTPDETNNTLTIAATGTVTSVNLTNTGGLTISGGPITSSGSISIGHTNSVTAQTTQALYPIKIDAYGHISGYGTAVTSLPASDVYPWAKAETKPSYNFDEIPDGSTRKLGNGAFAIKTKVGNTTTSVSSTSANALSDSDITLIQGSNVTLTPDATNKTITISAKEGTVTSVNLTNTGGLTISGGPITSSGSISIGHTNSVTAQTTQALYPIKIDAYGHISDYGDAITSLPASDVYPWAKAATKPTYNLDEVSDGSTRKLGNASFTIKTKVGSTTTDVASTTANATVDSLLTLIQGSNVTLTPDATNKTITISSTGTVTSVNLTNTGGLTISGGPITSSGSISIGHTNSVTAQTTQAVYPIKIDAYGHISGYGSAVTSMPASDVYAWAKAATKPSYTFDEIPDGSTRKLGNASFTIKTKVGSTTTDVASTTANATVDSLLTLIQGSNITLTPDATNKTITIAAKEGTVTSIGISDGGGLTVTGSPITSSGTITIKHTNSVTAQTTQALYPIKIDAYGHISGYGTAVTSLPASDVYAWAKAATKPTYSWSEITSKPTEFTPAAHTHNNIVTVGDTRSTATTPNDYSNIFKFLGIKNNSTIGSPSSDSYSYVFGLRGWSDSSGGDSYELAFNNTDVYIRHGATTSWGNWARLVTSANYTSYVNTTNFPGLNKTGTVTSVAISNGGGLSISGSPITTSGTITISHSNSVTAQTTQAVYPIKIDANGHISAYGSAVTSMPASDVYAWAKASTKPTYNLDEVADGSTRKLSNYALVGHTHNYAGSSSAGGAATSAVVSNSDSNSSYRMVWHSGNNLYSTADIYCNPSTDELDAKAMRATANNMYVGSASGSQCHMQYDSTEKSINFIFD